MTDAAGRMLRSRRGPFLLLYGTCFSVSLLVYSRSFDNSFRADDFTILTHVITHGLFAAMAPTEHIAFFRPASVALAFAEYKLFGLQSGLYLAFNYSLHLAVSLLTIKILLELGFGRFVATLAGTLFLLGYGHYGKPVMWASSGGSLSAVLLSLLAILLALRWMKREGDPKGALGGARRRGDLVLIAGMSLLAMLFYEGALLTPILIVFVLAVHPGREAIRKPSRLLLLFMPVILWTLIAMLVSRVHPQYENIMAATHVPIYFVKYCGFIAVPMQESATLPPAFHWLAAAFRHAHGTLLTVGVMVLVLVTTAAVKGSWKIRILAVWLFLAILPFTFVKLPSGFLELRYVYYAAIPFCGLAACAFQRLVSGRSRCVEAGAIVVLVGISISTTAVVHLLEQKYDAESRSALNETRLIDLRRLVANGNRE